MERIVKVVAGFTHVESVLVKESKKREIAGLNSTTQLVAALLLRPVLKLWDQQHCRELIIFPILMFSLYVSNKLGD